MNWTKQQSDAIQARDSSVIVSAAAGSGKTAVLTERIIRLIADPESHVRADRMVIVTFTNDAAAELKVRLSKKMRELITSRPSDTYLLKQQILLQSAHICTIDSFCFDFLRDNITEQGITSGFGVLDGSDNELLQQQAMDEMLTEFCTQYPDDYSLLYDRFCVRDESQLSAPLFAVDNFLSSVAFREEWLTKAEENYNCSFGESPYFDIAVGDNISALEDAMKAAKDNLEVVLDIFPDNTKKSAQAYIEQASEDYAFVSAVYECVKERKLPFGEKFKDMKFGSLKPASVKGINSEKREEYKNNRNIFKKPVSELLKVGEVYTENFTESAEVTPMIVRMMRRYYELLWEKKCEKNSISFDDGERLTLELLAERDENGLLMQSDIARSTAELYDIILIDEYQDSNNKQDCIFKLLSRNFKNDADGNALYGDNVFLVGDVKQSIYGFRLANPRNFISTLESSVPYSPDNSSPNKYIYLNQNFRSSPDVIDFVNYVFTGLMTREHSGIEYNSDEMLYFGAETYLQKPKKSFLTDIIFINDDSGDEDDTPDENSPEVRYTAQKIAEMLKNGAETVTPNGIRPCRPSDFCILVRTNEQVSSYIAELERIGVPVRKGEEQGYLRSREITILLDILRTIDNPLLDIPLTAVLTSPMYMFGMTEIAEIKALDRDKPMYVILRGLAGGEYPEFPDVTVRSRCAIFLEAMDSFRTDAVTMTLGELIGKIYDTTDFISVMQLYSDGDKKRANLRALIQYAQSYESFASSDGTPTLNGFLRHLDRIDMNKAVKGKGAAASGDCAQVMTLHKSKGLEFPFVFIAETSGRSRSDSVTAVCADDGLIGYVLYDFENCSRYKTFQQAYISAQKAQDNRNERLRLLYVGLTRAKQQLFINLKTGHSKLKLIRSLMEKLADGSLSYPEAAAGTDQLSHYIWLSLMRHRDFAGIAERLPYEDGVLSEYAPIPEADSDEEVFVTEYAELTDDFTEMAKKKHRTAPADEKLCEQLRSIINADYDTEFSKLPAKLSVTQITKKFDDSENDFDFSLKRPRFMSESQGLTGTERGTAIHTFFQYCDLESAAADPVREIERIEQLGFISAPQAASISTENTAAFFAGGLYQRIKSAANVWRERKFMIAVSETDIENQLMERLKKSDGMIKGIIDLMFEEEDGLVIVDYKSDRGIGETALAERYAQQLRLYKSAAELTMGKRVKQLLLWSFELRKAVEIKM